ncbi:uncharacterized protein EDB91DRAFT_1166633 [Suillus paluster]|uniref:uncharacterized protein n=1 Tax=Suillus paluster TaxID=48578 RepID=UPI001B881EAB|nr:uncharacterized protein EDB91DRAFT_1166573 [Suillus paluster]XP_041171256.1 uncharacterized protein EDB91DRAFT_1166633 [Suillus paluster]KAG1726176.1 hypothetical protein EDB91DRAFT_1166573 [Suillus paluster]KAG1726195.1 hypothetical protein EDB91DRAFT_1166633 [Suillus paluster]
MYQDSGYQSILIPNACFKLPVRPLDTYLHTYQSIPRKKHRLYIALYHHNAKSGFHFVLMLSPKGEMRNASIHDCHIYNTINTIRSSVKFDLNGMPEWRYEHKAVNDLREGTVIGRVLISKLPAHEPLVTQAERIHDILAQMSLVQNDAQWDCRVCMLAALRANGGDFSTIPEVTNGGQTEGEIRTFGDMTKESVLKGPGPPPSCASDLASIDIRVR